MSARAALAHVGESRTCVSPSATNSAADARTPRASDAAHEAGAGSTMTLTAGAGAAGGTSISRRETTSSSMVVGGVLARERFRDRRDEGPLVRAHDVRERGRGLRQQ